MRYNIFRTLWFNIKAFGLLKGLKFPVYVYGRVKVYDMGKIVFKCPLKSGLMKIGRNYDDTALPYTIWNNMGCIELYGPIWIHHGCRITNRGTIVFEGGDIISHACVFDIRDRIEFGKNVSVGYCSEFSDTDVHYMVDVKTREVHPNTRPIRIGSFNWFGSHTYVKKGTVTPDYVTVASPNALLLRDYTEDVPEHAILAGSPAKIVSQGKRRILNFKNEIKIDAMFKSKCIDRNKNVYSVAEEINLDDFCGLKI